MLATAPGIAVGVAMILAVFSGAVGLPRQRPNWPGLVGIGLLAPLIATGLAIARIDDHRYQRRADQVFTRYTHRFPPGVLHDRFIQERVGGYVTECAHQGGGDLYFCLEMTVGHRAVRGHEVEGGFRWRAKDQDPDNHTSFIDNAFDCFGETITCE